MHHIHVSSLDLSGAQDPLFIPKRLIKTTFDDSLTAPSVMTCRSIGTIHAVYSMHRMLTLEAQRNGVSLACLCGCNDTARLSGRMLELSAATQRPPMGAKPCFCPSAPPLVTAAAARPRHMFEGVFLLFSVFCACMRVDYFVSLSVCVCDFVCICVCLIFLCLSLCVLCMYYACVYLFMHFFSRWHFTYASSPHRGACKTPAPSSPFTCYTFKKSDYATGTLLKPRVKPLYVSYIWQGS